MRILFTSLILSVLFVGTASAVPMAYVSNSNSNTVSVIDLSTNMVVGTIDVGEIPLGVTVAASDCGPNGAMDGFVGYVVNKDDDNVSEFTLSPPFSVIRTVQVGKTPSGIVWGGCPPQGGSGINAVYVTNTLSNSVSQIEVGSSTALTKTLDDLDIPSGITVIKEFGGITSQFGPIFIANLTNSGPGGGTIINDKLDVLGQFNTGDDPKGIAAFLFSPDTVEVVMTNVNSDILTSELVPIAGGEPKEQTTTLVGMSPFDIVLTQDELLMVSNFSSNTVSVQPLSTMFQTTITVGEGPKGLDWAPSLHSLYVVNSLSNTVSVIEISERKVIDTIDVGESPSDIAVLDTEEPSLMDPDPMGDGNGSSSNSCALAGPGTTKSYSLMLLFIPAIILIRRLRRRRTN